MRFQMLDLEKSDDCEYDHIELSDGITGKRLVKLCGKKTPKNYIVSTGNKMKVKFNTDSDVHHRGFALTFVTGLSSFFFLFSFFIFLVLYRLKPVKILKYLMFFLTSIPFTIVFNKFSLTIAHFVTV